MLDREELLRKLNSMTPDEVNELIKSSLDESDIEYVVKNIHNCPFEGSDIVCDDGALGFDGSVKQCPTTVFNKCQKGFL